MWWCCLAAFSSFLFIACHFPMHKNAYAHDWRMIDIAIFTWNCHQTHIPFFSFSSAPLLCSTADISIYVLCIYMHSKECKWMLRSVLNAERKHFSNFLKSAHHPQIRKLVYFSMNVVEVLKLWTFFLNIFW